MVIENIHNFNAKILLSHLETGFTEHFQQTKGQRISFSYASKGDVLFVCSHSGQRLILIYVHEIDITLAKHYHVETAADLDSMITALADYIDR